MPQWIELLTVEHTFWLKRPGVQMLILHPDLPIPKGWNERGWSKRNETVLIRRPDGTEVEARAEINMTHLNIANPEIAADERWRITLWLSDKTAEDVPVGSKVLVPHDVRAAIVPEDARSSRPNT